MFGIPLEIADFFCCLKSTKLSQMLKFQNSLKINTKTFAQLPNLAYICKRIKEVIYTANSLKGERQLHNKRQKLK